jgi:hypothetical protein
LSADCKLAPELTTVLAPGAGVLARDEFTVTRGNSAGPSVDANAAAAKLNTKAAVTTMNVAECRINAWLGNTGPVIRKTCSLVETVFLEMGDNEKYVRCPTILIQ